MKISNKAKYNMLPDDILDMSNIKIELDDGHRMIFSTIEEAYTFCEIKNLSYTEWCIL